MRKTLSLLLLAMLMPFIVLAEKWTPETLPMVHLQDARRYVCNPDGVLSQAATDSTDRMLYALQRDKGVQTVVVVVKELEGADAYQFGMDLGRKYGVGSKTQRTGLILILSTEDRLYQILTGNGLEGTLPDAICRRIENRVMIPFLKEEKWDSAIVATVKSIDGYVRGDDTLKAEDEEEEGDLFTAIVVVVLFGGIFLWLILAFAKFLMPKCPNCQKVHMREVKRQRVKVGKRKNWKQRVTYQCPRCGHKMTRLEDISESSGSTFSSSGGSSFSGGGSFGGGSFGGGGSGGSF